MNLAFPAQELPARNALTVGVSCMNRIRKPVADAARSSVRPAFSFIEHSTRSLLMENVESGKEHKCRAGSRVAGACNSIRFGKHQRIPENRILYK